MEPYEDDLRIEADVLDKLVKLFGASEEMLGAFIEEGTNYLDPKLINCLQYVQFVIASGLQEGFELETGEKVPGLVRQYDNVLDEITTLQAGKPTKDGIPFED